MTRACRLLILLSLTATAWIVSRPVEIKSSQAATAAAKAPQSAAEIYESVYNGWKWWHVYCYRCHGQDALGTTLAPNLTDPNVKLALPEFLKKVRNGSPEKGMQ